MDNKQISIFEEIFKTLDEVAGSVENADGLETLGAILNLSNEDFELLKEPFLANIDNIFNQQDVKIALAEMIQHNGITVEDLEDNLENLIEAINELAAEGVELSESKKDFLKRIFTTFLNAMNGAKAISHRIIQIPVIKCRENVKLPTYATDGSAAMDIYAVSDFTVKPGETIIVPTGLKVNLPKGYALLIQPRSGLSVKTKIRIANTPGLIDSDYHEEIGVIVENIDPPIKEIGTEIIDGKPIDGNLYGSSFSIGAGERFAQMRLVEVPLVNWLEVASFGELTSDHGKGFGSTGST